VAAEVVVGGVAMDAIVALFQVEGFDVEAIKAVTWDSYLKGFHVEIDDGEYWHHFLVRYHPKRNDDDWTFGKFGFRLLDIRKSVIQQNEKLAV
jgi:hypothetical protein